MFGSLCALVFLVNFARVVYAPLLETFRAEFAATAGEVGLLATLVWVGSAALRIPTGYALTRVPRHRVVLVTGGLLAVSATLAAVTTSLEQLYVGALLMGLASGAYFIAANPLISELFPRRVGRVVGVHGTASQLAAVGAPLFVIGVFAAPAAAGLVAWPIAAWRVVFLAVAAGAVLATVLFFLTTRRASLPDAGRADRDLLVALRHQWPLVVTAVAFVGLAGFVWNGVFNFYSSYLIAAKGFGEDRAWIGLMVVFGAGVPAFWLTGRAADRFPQVPLLVAVVGGFAACLGALTVVESWVGVLVVSAITGYVVHSLFPIVDTFLLSTLPDEHRASAYALYSGSMMFVQASGSAVVGRLVDAGNSFDDVFRALAVLLVALFVAMLALYRLRWLPTDSNR